MSFIRGSRGIIRITSPKFDLDTFYILKKILYFKINR